MTSATLQHPVSELRDTLRIEYKGPIPWKPAWPRRLHYNGLKCPNCCIPDEWKRWEEIIDAGSAIERGIGRIARQVNEFRERETRFKEKCKGGPPCGEC